MGTLYEAEKAAHEKTKLALDAAGRNLAFVICSWGVDSDALVEARVHADRAALERTRLLERIRQLDEEAEALRNQVAVLALAAGGGAVL